MIAAAKLLIFFFAGLSRVLISPESTTVVDAGDRLLLPCVVFTTISSDDSANPITTRLIWKNGDQVLQNGSRITIHENVSTHTTSGNGGRVAFVKSILEVCGVERGDHGREYSCSVVATAAGGSTGQEERDTATFQLHVLTAPGKHFL